MLDTAAGIHAADKPRSRAILDGVQRELARHPDPTLIARAQFLECTWAADDPPSAYRAADIGLAAAQRAGNLTLRAKLVACRAAAIQFEGREADAEREYAVAAAVARQAKAPDVEADALHHVGELQYFRGAMADALTTLQIAYRADERLGREAQRLDALTVMANVYADPQVAQYGKAIEYYRQLLADYERLRKADSVADTLYNIGNTYETQGDFRSAEDYYGRALAAFEKLGQPTDIAYTKRGIGSALMKQGRSAEALPLFDAALAYFDGAGEAGNAAWVRQFRGMANRRLGRLDDALRDLDAARMFFEKEKNVRFLEKNAEEQAILHAQRGDWRSAYEDEKRRGALEQALAATRRDESSSRLRVEFDAAKKEQENRALARENTLRAAALREAQRNQKLQFVVIALTALLAMALAILFWRQVANTRRMRAMALTDELTRLPNRRHIFAAAEIAFAAAKRESRAAAVIVFDIDRFKRINDTYGHATGDVVLQRIAHTCRRELRPADALGRIGGEEFLIVLHDATPQQAKDIAERLRAAVERIDFASIDANLRVTISLGVRVAHQYETGPAVAAADSLLYRAKESGRDRVEMEVSAA